MNFIGHATVALWRSTEPLYVLGSMLPDFASMAGTRLAREEPGRERRLAHGIALHHRTDDVFHGVPFFTGLVQETVERLTAEGVSRGAARAVGHVGVEMLIDGELLRSPEVAHAYTAALQVGARVTPAFVEPAGLRRWHLLRERLLAHGPPHDYRDPEGVLWRLTHVLARRPRLALDAAASAQVRAALPGVQRRVIAGLGALLEVLRARLDETAPGISDGYFT